MPAITACVHDQIRIVSLMDLNFTAIVARELMKLSDLRGQRIGYAFGSNAHYALLTALSANGVTESEVTLVPMEVDAMPLALDQGRIDAFSAWEPIPSVAAQVYGHKVIHQFLSSGYLYFSRSFAERHPEWVAQLVAAEFRALNWLEQSESHFFRAVSWSAIAIRNFQGRDFDLSRKEMMKLVRSGIHNLWTLPVIPVTDLTEEGHIGRESHFLGTIGKIPRSVPWESIKKCFHWEVGEQVLFAPARYHLNEFDVRGVTK
ncbi:MAG: ABC transporter substrate-binding protein [Magnetococcales bacterium]|nr:ABC transporter substrate-binding protein [Magnetococcales bacterium]